MREHSVPCCICRSSTFHDDAVCGRGGCVELMAHSQRRIQDRLAAKVIRQAGSDAATLTSSGVAATFAAVALSHGNAPSDRGSSPTDPSLTSSPLVRQGDRSESFSTGPAGGSHTVAGSVEPSGGSTRFPSPDERPSVAPPSR